MPRVKPGEKRIYLKFTRPEDVELYERLSKDADKQRYPLGVYLLLVLHAAYPKQDQDSLTP